MSNIKENFQDLTKSIRDIRDQEKQISMLKDSLKGETCYIISCGPTLLENNLEKLKEELSKNICISIKQSFLMFEEFVDIHVYNCANYKNYEYGERKPLVIDSSSYPFRLGKCDISFTIKERNFQNSVSAKQNYSDWTFDKKPFVRPYGPGIMTETIIFLIQHLGVSNVVTVGWDSEYVGENKLKQHFYTVETTTEKHKYIDSNDTQSIVQKQKLLEEKDIASEGIMSWYNWLKDNGTEIKICSKINPAPQQIKRVVI